MLSSMHLLKIYGKIKNWISVDMKNGKMKDLLHISNKFDLFVFIFSHVRHNPQNLKYYIMSCTSFYLMLLLGGNGIW